MKSHRVQLFVVLLSLSVAALAQSSQPAAGATAASPHDHGAAVQPAPTEAQTAFTLLKSLAGKWEGKVEFDGPKPADANGDALVVTLRALSRGNSIVHEIGDEADVAPKGDHPVTMLYLESDRLLLTHYCDAGNRPRMVGKVSPDGKTVEFSFLDVSGPTKFGHMDHAVFTIVDANHHIEQWTYLLPNGKAMSGRMLLERKQPVGTSNGK
jgi:hypothetical protein